LKDEVLWLSDICVMQWALNFEMFSLNSLQPAALAPPHCTALSFGSEKGSL
jgi:hypothetical protein